jgi:hypothetical protein
LVGLEEFSMRAIPSQHRRRGLAAGLVMTSVIALSILSGGTALAASPTWPSGHGTDFQANPAPGSGASSSSVSAGKAVGFFEWLRNPGSSNISQLFLNATADTGLTQLGAKWTIKTDAGAVVRSGTCTINSVPLCSFGALNAGQTVYALVAYSTDAALVDGVSRNVSFDFNSTGIPPGGNKSHGDDVIVKDSILISKNDDAAGDFTFDQASLTVANAGVGGSNTQQTLLTIFAPQVGAFVNDSPSLPAAKCTNALIADIVAQNSWFSCKKLSTLTSLIEAGGGGTFTNPNGGPGIKVVVSFASPPSQLNGGHPFVYHVWTDATGEHAELVTATCTLDSGGFPTNQGPCLIVGTNNVTFWLLHNGNARM